MSYTVTDKAFRDLVVALTGFSDTLVLFSYGDAGRPTVDHITVLPFPDTRKGYPFTSGTDVSQRREKRYQLDGYGSTAVDAVRRYSMLIESDDKRVTDLISTFGINGVGSVADTTTDYRTGYEARATLDVMAGYIATVSNAEPQPTATQIDLTVTSQESTATLPDVAPIP